MEFSAGVPGSTGQGRACHHRTGHRLPAGANTQFAAETCSQLLEEYEEESEETFHLIPTRCLLTGNFHGISPNNHYPLNLIFTQRCQRHTGNIFK